MVEALFFIVAVGIICAVICGGFMVFGLLTYPEYKKQGGKKSLIQYISSL